jgi:O-antigen/teichoic acid export membrane protein
MLSTPLRLSKNALARLSAQAIGRFLSLALAALIARYEGASGLGRYALVFSMVGIAAGLADLGLNTFLTREAARTDDRDQQRHLLGNVLILKAGLTSAGYVGLLLIAHLLPFPLATKGLIVLGGVSLFPQAVTGTVGALINARQRMEVTGILEVVVRLATVAGSLPLLVQGHGVAGVIVWSVTVSGLSVLLYVAWLWRWQLLPLFRSDVTAWRKCLGEAYPFGLTMGLTTLYARLDLLLLSLWQGETVAGWYSAAYKSWEALSLVPSSLLFALFPEMSRLSTSRAGLARFRALFRLGRRMMPLAGLLVAVGSTVWAPDLMALVYGRAEDLTPTIVTFRLLVWAFPMVFMTMLGGRVLYAIGQQHQVLRIMVVVGLFNLLLNLIAIPRWSYLGAGLVALASEVLLWGLIYRQARRALGSSSSLPHTLSTGGYVSAQATVADLDGDGQPEIIAGSDALYAWRLDKRLLPGFPVRGGNFFASRPAVGDFDGDDCLEILVGCDDDALYVFDVAGKLRPGWPRQTGGDVFSSPVLVDLDDDGQLEVVIGSDDGCLYVWRADGSSLEGWPQCTGGFVSASPTLADLDGDGHPEIIVGSWDCRLYVWRADGTFLPGWPQATDHFVWSTAAVGDLNGDGRLEVVVASDQVYAWSADGSRLPGWPQAMDSYSAGSPLLADLDGDGRLEVILGADRLYAWRSDGCLLPDFPVDLNTFLWSSPALGDVDGDGQPEIVIGGWDGGLHIVEADGGLQTTYATKRPIFATPTLADLDHNGKLEIIIGSWDSKIYIFGHNHTHPRESVPFWARAFERSKTVDLLSAGRFTQVDEYVAPFVTFPGPTSSRAVLRYRAHFETEWHPVPLVVHRGRLTGLIQPSLAGTRVQYYAEVWHKPGRPQRIPPKGTFDYTVRANWAARLRRLSRSYSTAILKWSAQVRLPWQANAAASREPARRSRS